MQSIQLNDRFGFEFEVALAPMSSLLQYVKAMPQEITSQTPLAKIGALTLADPGVKSLAFGLDFSQPFTLGASLPQLQVNAAASASFEVIQVTPDRNHVFFPDDYGENIAIPAGSCYVRFGLNAAAGAGPTLTSGSLTFGATVGSAVRFDNWRQFPAGPTAPLVTDALGQCIGGFHVPATFADLEAIPAEGLAAVTVTGTLEFCATANLLAIANPLATAVLPDGLPTLSIQQSAAVNVGANWKIAAEYQVRAQKTAAGRIRLGWYRKHSSDFTVTASANAGIPAGTATTDLFGTLITAISANPAADLKALQAAGVGMQQMQAIQSAVKAAVDRKLELAVVGALGSLAADEAAFLFEIDPSSLDDSGRGAIQTALAGDLTGLLTKPAGISPVRDIMSTVRERHSSWRINLLGIYNFGSIAKLAIQGVVLFSDATGELVISDKATASRVRTDAVNFGAAEDKLCHVLAESFLITAVYRGSRTVISGPQLSSSHIFFADERNASRERLNAFLRDAAALAFSGPAPPADTVSFGRTTLFIEANYDDEATESIFLNSAGKARDVGEYETVGRKSMDLLVDPKTEAFRLPPLTDSALWARMKDLGPPQFPDLFGAPEVGAITSDYLTIRWWSDTMSQTADVLAGVKEAFIENPALSPASPEFQKLREQLAGALKAVAGKTPDEFGAPWGLVAMYALSSGKADVQVKIISPRFVFSQERALQKSA